MLCLRKLNVISLLNGCQSKFLRSQSACLSSLKVTRDGYVYDQNPDEATERDQEISRDVLSKVNQQIKEKAHGRLFAVIKLGERQFKITAEDIIALNTHFPASVGDKIRLEKVLLVGSTDFTLLGRPLLSKDLVRIEATLIEKTYIIPRPLYRHGRVRYKRLHWFRTPYALFCINSIEFTNSLDTLPSVENVQGRVIY